MKKTLFFILSTVSEEKAKLFWQTVISLFHLIAHCFHRHYTSIFEGAVSMEQREDKQINCQLLLFSAHSYLINVLDTVFNIPSISVRANTSIWLLTRKRIFKQNNWSNKIALSLTEIKILTPNNIYLYCIALQKYCSCHFHIQFVYCTLYSTVIFLL